MMVSDASLKENIIPIQDTSTLLELLPREFTMKGGSKLQYGFVAQELENTPYRNLVYQNREGIKSIAYTQLISVLTAHIQSLSKRVAELENNQNRRNPEFLH